MYILERLCTFNVKITLRGKQKATGYAKPEVYKRWSKILKSAFVQCFTTLIQQINEGEKKSLTLTRQSCWCYFICYELVILNQRTNWRDVTKRNDIIDYILYLSNLNCSNKVDLRFLCRHGLSSSTTAHPDCGADQRWGQLFFFRPVTQICSMLHLCSSTCHLWEESDPISTCVKKKQNKKHTVL